MYAHKTIHIHTQCTHSWIYVFKKGFSSSSSTLLVWIDFFWKDKIYVRIQSSSLFVSREWRDTELSPHTEAWIHKRPKDSVGTRWGVWPMTAGCIRVSPRILPNKQRCQGPSWVCPWIIPTIFACSIWKLIKKILKDDVEIKNRNREIILNDKCLFVVFFFVFLFRR